jgi:hypothetical protein
MEAARWPHDLEVLFGQEHHNSTCWERPKRLWIQEGF